MVDLKTPYELNHIYSFWIANEERAVGTATPTVIENELVTFEKSLALSSDLKRLPIIRSAQIIPHFDARLAAALTGAAVNLMTFRIRIFNREDVPDQDDDDEKDNGLIGEVSCYCSVASSKWVILEVEHFEWFLKGGLVNDAGKVSMWGQIRFDGTTATNPIPAGYIEAICQLEIDWFPVSDKQMKDFAVEHIFARDA